MKKLKVAFIGGMTDGKIVFEYLSKNKYVDLCLTITYPDNTEVPRHVNFPESKNIIKTNSANQYADKFNDLDYIFVCGWSELLGNEILKSPKKEVIGFHPSKLPKDRGRSVVAWQIEDGYTEIALTMFYYIDFPDGGDILAQENIKIEQNDYLNDVLDKIDDATYNLMCANFQLLRKGLLESKKQILSEGNFRRLRTSKDSKINWNTNSINIYNKIRAISNPYPCAEATIEDKQFKIVRSSILEKFNFGNDLVPGKLVAKLHDGSFIVKTKDAFILIEQYREI
jgi:methionyl-tRNA formyltransferase